MKNKNFQQSRTHKTLEQFKRNGKKAVVWKLTPEMASFLERFYGVYPYLYTIKTRCFSNVRLLNNSLLKEIHYSKKKGKDFLTLPLNKQELITLDAYNVSYRLLKYKIELN